MSTAAKPLVRPEAGVLWLRYHAKTPGFADLDPVALEWHSARRQATVREWDGHLWIVLHLPRQYDLPAAVDALRNEVMELHDALTGGSRER